MTAQRHSTSRPARSADAESTAPAWFPRRGPGEELAVSPFVDLGEPGDDGTCAALERITGQRYAIDSETAQWLRSIRPGRHPSALSTEERRRADWLRARWILLDQAAWRAIRRLSFDVVDLEIAGSCNAACVFCPREALRRGRGVGLMKATAFARIVDQLEGVTRRVGLVGIGEPTLHRQLVDFVGRLRSAGIETLMITNGSRLTDALVDALVDARLSGLVVSFTGHRKATYEANMVGLDYDDVRRRVERVVSRARGRLPVTVTAVRTRENAKDLAGFVAFWRRRRVKATITPCHSRGGTVPSLSVLPAGPADRRCGYFSARTFVAWNGDVLSCCHDISGATRLGNLVEEGLETIIDRKLSVVAFNRWFHICADCDEPSRADRHAPSPE